MMKKSKQAPKIIPKRPVVALLSNLILEGLGFIYLRRLKWGVLNLLFALFLGSMIGWLIPLHSLKSFLASNYFIPVVILYRVLNGLAAYYAARYVNAHPVLTRRRPGVRLKKLTQKDLLEIGLLLVTAVATTFAAYATYRNYVSQHQKPILSLFVFKVDGTDEIPLVEAENSACFPEAYSDKVLTEFKLPLKLSNSGPVTAEGIVLWLDVDVGELILPQPWQNQKYAGRDRWHMNVSDLYPETEIELKGMRLRIKNDSRKVRLAWSIIAKNALPQKGSITLNL